MHQRLQTVIPRRFHEKGIYVKKLIEIHNICMREEAEIGLKKLEAPIPT